MFDVCGFNTSCRSYFANQLSLNTPYTSLYLGQYNVTAGSNRFNLKGSVLVKSGSMFYIEMHPGLVLSLVSNSTNIDYEVLSDMSLSPLMSPWNAKSRLNFRYHFDGIFYVFYEDVYHTYNTSGTYSLTASYTDFNRSNTKTMVILSRKPSRNAS